MANNVVLFDAYDNPVVIATTEVGGVHTQHALAHQGDAGVSAWPVAVGRYGGDPFQIYAPPISGINEGGNPVHAIAASIVQDLAKVDVGEGGPYVIEVLLVDSTGAALGTSDNPVATSPARSSSAIVTPIASAVEDTLLSMANAAVKTRTLFNDSAAVCYVKFGNGSTPTSFTVKMLAGGYYEVLRGYSGDLYGYWPSANGYMYVTEVS